MNILQKFKIFTLSKESWSKNFVRYKQSGQQYSVQASSVMDNVPENLCFKPDT